MINRQQKHSTKKDSMQSKYQQPNLQFRTISATNCSKIAFFDPLATVTYAFTRDQRITEIHMIFPVDKCS